MAAVAPQRVGRHGRTPDPLGIRPAGHILLVDASCLGQPGGTGDDWRLHLAYDFTAGRLGQVQGTDRRGGEHLERYQWQAGAVVVADRGYGYRRSVALAVRQHAEVVVRMHPATFPLETDAEQPFSVLRWLRQRGDATRDWHGWCRWQGCRYRVRLVAARLDPATARQVRRRQRRKAQKAGRRLTAPTRAVAGWILVITTLAAATWSAAAVLALYRARWQVDSVFLRLQQLLEPFGITKFYTDGWGAYERHIEAEQHQVGKENTQKIESKHMNLRTRMKRLVRRTLCFSKTKQMHDLVIGLFINRYEFGLSL